MADEPQNPAQLARKRTNLARLRDQFTEQESILNATWTRSENWQGASDSQMEVMRELFQDSANALPEKNIRFIESNNFEGLIAQISSVRSKVNEALADIEANLGISPSSTSFKGRETDSQQRPPHTRRVFVVHGRDEKVRQAMFAFLRAVGLDPIEWEEAISMTGQGAPYTGQAIDAAFLNAHAAVILLTGDDLACLKQEFIVEHDEDTERKPTPQARPNVLFELGLAFGRKPDRTIIVEFGKTRPISDSLGRNVIRFADTPDFRQKLAGRLRSAGCAVDTNHKSDWLTATFEFPSVSLLPANDARFGKEQFETPKRVSTIPRLEALSATPSVEESPAPVRPDTSLSLKWAEHLSVYLEIQKDPTAGCTVYVANESDAEIASFQFAVSEAAFWSNTHQKFLPQKFAFREILSGKNLEAMRRSDGTTWLVRIFREGREHCLAVGNDTRNLLKPPNHEPPQACEVWRLSVNMAYDSLVQLGPKNQTRLRSKYIEVRWDKNSETVQIRDNLDEQ